MARDTDREDGDRIVPIIVHEVPCFFHERPGCCVVVERRDRGGDSFEIVVCLIAGRTFRRAWVCN